MMGKAWRAIAGLAAALIATGALAQDGDALFVPDSLELAAAGYTFTVRSTDGTVHVCLEGSGEVRVGEQSWRFQENDVFVVPSWHSLQIRADRDATLFSYSDRPVQQALGLWREERQ